MVLYILTTCVYLLINFVYLSNILGGLVDFFVIDVGKISCTGRRINCTSRSNRKKPFKITCLNRIPVLSFFPSSVHTYLHA
jgi:hypothetical protein